MQLAKRAPTKRGWYGLRRKKLSFTDAPGAVGPKPEIHGNPFGFYGPVGPEDQGVEWMTYEEIMRVRAAGNQEPCKEHDWRPVYHGDICARCGKFKNRNGHVVE